jgi:hypothetical protein
MKRVSNLIKQIYTGNYLPAPSRNLITSAG